jgi:hypothetical protein
MSRDDQRRDARGRRLPHAVRLRDAPRPRGAGRRAHHGQSRPGQSYSRLRDTRSRSERGAARQSPSTRVTLRWAAKR